MERRKPLLAPLKPKVERTAEPTLFDDGSHNKLKSLRFSFIDLFAGIGGFRIGLTRAGGNCVFTSEWDKYCQQTYRAWFPDSEIIHGDINLLDINRDIPPHDVLAAGFPCQPFSIAGVSKKNSLGRQHGFKDEKQGNLFFRICDIIITKRPPILFLENVKNLKSHDGGSTWKVIYEKLKELGYKVFAQIIDAQAWVPQHRERIFIVCFDLDVFPADFHFTFPHPPQGPAPRLGSILENRPDAKYTLTEHLWNYLQRYAEKHKAQGNGFGYGLVGPDDVTRTLSARYYKDGSEILIKNGARPRRLTYREAARLMGYTDEIAAELGHKHGFPQVVSDMQGYKQFGNAVVPQVVEAIAHHIVDSMAYLMDQRANGCLIKGHFTPLRRHSVRSLKLNKASRSV